MSIITILILFFSFLLSCNNLVQNDPISTTAGPNTTTAIKKNPIHSYGPYLQQGTLSTMTIRWKTTIPCSSQINYSLKFDSLNNTVKNEELKVYHEFKLKDLQANTKYFYEILSCNSKISTDEKIDSFFTSPQNNVPVRIWALGSAGTGSKYQKNVRDAFLNFTKDNPAQLILLLGDNAYQTGTEEEYAENFFLIYADILKNTVTWPAIGNHDVLGNSDTPEKTYFKLFTLPTNAEAGGVKSGTEKYYSFDYSNIHFVVLDSVTSSVLRKGKMASWLKRDLAQTKKDWIIAYFHYDIYTHALHNSDKEAESIDIRKNIAPILEAGNVDLVLTSNSHSYERSYLLSGLFGPSSEFNSTFCADKKKCGIGRNDSPSGAYIKSKNPKTHEGTIYSVVGSSGDLREGPLTHPANVVGLNMYGSLLIDISDNKLDVKFIDYVGNIGDYYSIIKQ